MQRTLTPIVIRAGILSADMVSELQRWGLPVEFTDTDSVLETPDQVVEAIQEAIESRDLVELRDTDLDAIRQYVFHQTKGKLHLHDTITDQSSQMECYYSKTSLGEYLIPWRAESIQALMTDPGSYLKEGSGQRVYFHDVRELFFGELKAFMVCVPKENKHGAH